MDRKLRYQGIPKPKAGGRIPGPQNAGQMRTIQQTQTCSVTQVVEQPQPSPCPVAQPAQGGARPKQLRQPQNRLVPPKPAGALAKPCAVAKQVQVQSPHPRPRSPVRARTPGRVTPVNQQQCDSPKQAKAIPQRSGIAQPRRSLQAPKALAKPAASPVPKSPVAVERLVQKPDACVAATGLLPMCPPAAASPARAKRPAGGGFGFGAKRAPGLKPPSSPVVPKIVAVPVEPKGATPPRAQRREEQRANDRQGMVEVPVVVPPGSPPRSILVPLEVACTPVGALVAIEAEDSSPEGIDCSYSRYEEECEELEGAAALNVMKQLCLREEAERLSTLISLEGMQQFRRSFVMDALVTPEPPPKAYSPKLFANLCADEEFLDSEGIPDDWDDADETCRLDSDEFVCDYTEIEEEIDPFGLFRRREVHSVASITTLQRDLIDLGQDELASEELFRLVQI